MRDALALLLDGIELPDELDLLIGDTQVLAVDVVAGLETALAELKDVLLRRPD